MNATTTTAGKQMADTSNMAVVHSAMRRDLVQTGLLLSDPSADEPATRELLGAHLAWFLDFLDHHHRAEDRLLWPVFRARSEEAAALASEMEAEHGGIGTAITALRRAAHSYRQGLVGRSELATTVRVLLEALAPHLAHEEATAMPLAARLITRKEWMQFEKDGALKGRSRAELGWDANWILDGTSEEQRRQFLQGVPRLARILIFDRYATAYRTDRDRLWQGTAAAGVPSLSAAELAARAG